MECLTEKIPRKMLAQTISFINLASLQQGEYHHHSMSLREDCCVFLHRMMSMST